MRVIEWPGVIETGGKILITKLVLDSEFDKSHAWKTHWQELPTRSILTTCGAADKCQSTA
ncbi:MAG: hypothetical protein KDA65_08470 [Planctomycetaceae bacterium]|nr:hypothetical protein [Planctomycetaceae bacterium]